MSRWHLHFLNARNNLTRLMPEIRQAGNQAMAKAGLHCAVPPFDLVVQAVDGGGIPDWGVGGYAPGRGLIEITVDPARWNEEFFTRTLLHELHHVMRWDGPGYGETLGEVLVSEGLAGHFVVQVLGGKPDPWDRVTPVRGLAGRALREWDNAKYDHGLWFAGKGDLPRWTAYGMGHALVAQHLARHSSATAAALAAEPSETLRVTMRAMTVNDELVPQGKRSDKPRKD